MASYAFFGRSEQLQTRATNNAPFLDATKVTLLQALEAVLTKSEADNTCCWNVSAEHNSCS
jgi:hypothetical protein